MAKKAKRKNVKKVRDILGTEIFRDLDTGEEFFYDFINKKEVKL